MLRRSLGLAFVLVALGLCLYGVVARRHEVLAALVHFPWYVLPAAVLAAILALGLQLLAWRTLLADLGWSLDARAAIRVMFIGQLGKYVPGGLWAPAAQVELSRAFAVPRTPAAVSMMTAMLVTLTTALMVVAVTLPLTSAQASRQFWWALALAPFLLVGLHPKVVHATLSRILRLARRSPLGFHLSAAAMIRAIGWCLLSWMLWGVHAWLLVEGAGARGGAVLPVAVGAYALAWAVGYLVILAPGGVGAREAALVVALAPVLPLGSALVVAVASRFATVLADLIWAGLASVVGGTRKHVASTAAEKSN